MNSVNAQWQRYGHYDSIKQAIRKAQQLGAPYCQEYPDLDKHLPEQSDDGKSDESVAGEQIEESEERKREVKAEAKADEAQANKWKRNLWTE